MCDHKTTTVKPPTIAAATRFSRESDPYVCVCVCVCPEREREREGETERERERNREGMSETIVYDKINK